MPNIEPKNKSDSLSVWGWSVLLTRAAAITFGLFAKAVGALFSSRRKGLTFHQYVGYAGVRDFQLGLDAIGIQNLRPSTSKTCERFAKKHGLERLEIQLPDGTIAQWLGPREWAKVVVLFHGGGYMAPALNEHLLLPFGLTKPLRKDVSAVILQYDLASENANHYPRQLQQAVSLLDYLLHFEKVPASVITLIGDSAGAHLLLSLVLHICHLNSLVPSLNMEGHFSGAVLISPWIQMDTSAKSMQVNKDKDILTVKALEYWARNFLGNAVLDNWNAPSRSPREWLSDLPIDKILILYGEDELLRDDTFTFCETLMTHHPRTTTLKFSREIHSHMILNMSLKINKPSESGKVFADWMNDHLR